MISFLRVVFMMCIVVGVASIIAADDDEVRVPAVVNARVVVYAGPGNTYAISDVIGAEIGVEIVERNTVGQWVRVQRAATGTDGWVQIGYLDLPGDFQLSVLPVTDLLDADTSGILDPDAVRLYSFPVVPVLSEAMIEVFEFGLTLGNRPDVISKVGDSNSANTRYLTPLAEGNYDLGAYDYLQEAVSFYAASLSHEPLASQVGLNAFSVFDSMWANPDRCLDDESPLACEYRINQPSIAVILFGQNDTRALNTEQWGVQMRRIVEQSLEMGVIPLLLTFSADRESEFYWQAIRFNLVLLDIAEEYDVPLLNFWAAARILPRFGIGDDDAHLTGGGNSIIFNGQESRLGVPLLNLMVLYALDEIRRTLLDHSEAMADYISQ